MLKVLIVDDDQLLREDLKHLIDWGENGFRIVGEAANGQEALELLKNHEVDLVIADIHMPIVNGVDLIKKASQVYPWVKFLVISNYDDFVYVKEAMKYGAVDYILKYETEPDQLLPVLNNVKSVIANERQTTLALEKLYQLSAKGHSKMMEEFWGRLLFDREYCRSSAALSEANNLEIELSRSYFMVVLVELFSVEKNGEDHKSCFETIAEEPCFVHPRPENYCPITGGSLRHNPRTKILPRSHLRLFCQHHFGDEEKIRAGYPGPPGKVPFLP